MFDPIALAQSLPMWLVVYLHAGALLGFLGPMMWLVVMGSLPRDHGWLVCTIMALSIVILWPLWVLGFVVGIRRRAASRFGWKT